MRLIIVLTVYIAVIAGAPQTTSGDESQRIVGGSVATINQYPAIAAVLYSFDAVDFIQICGGSILNNRSVLTNANCMLGNYPVNLRFRVGSSWANSRGVVYNVNYLLIHGNYNPTTVDSDIAIMRSATTIIFSNVVAAASIAGSNYNAGDNAVVWAAGWGSQWYGGPKSELLRHVQIWTVNQNVCAQRYGYEYFHITSNMLCAGWLDVGGVGTCVHDRGGPLYHNGIVIGVTSYGRGCGDAFFPGVFVRVSSFTSWIQANA